MSKILQDINIISSQGDRSGLVTNNMNSSTPNKGAGAAFKNVLVNETGEFVVGDEPIAYTQTQSDWEQTDNLQVDYIKNKPVIQYADFVSLPLVGDENVIYITQDDNSLYRWDTLTVAYVPVSDDTGIVYSLSDGTQVFVTVGNRGLASTGIGADKTYETSQEIDPLTGDTTNQTFTGDVTYDGANVNSTNSTYNNNGDTVNNNSVTETNTNGFVTNINQTITNDANTEITNNGTDINNNSTTENNTGVTENYDDTSVTNNNGNTTNNTSTTENNVGVVENYDDTSVTNNNGNTTNNNNTTENYNSTFTPLGCSGSTAVPIDELINVDATKIEVEISYDNGVGDTWIKTVVITEASGLVTVNDVANLHTGEFTIEWNTVSGNLEVRQTGGSGSSTADVCQFSGGVIINDNGSITNNDNTVVNNDNTTTNNTGVDEYYDETSSTTNLGDSYFENIEVNNIIIRNAWANETFNNVTSVVSLTDIVSDAGSIFVWVDGTPLFEGDDWTYNSVTNDISFSPVLSGTNTVKVKFMKE